MGNIFSNIRAIGMKPMEPLIILVNSSSPYFFQFVSYFGKCLLHFNNNNIFNYNAT